MRRALVPSFCCTIWRWPQRCVGTFSIHLRAWLTRDQFANMGVEYALLKEVLSSDFVTPDTIVYSSDVARPQARTYLREVSSACALHPAHAIQLTLT